MEILRTIKVYTDEKKMPFLVIGGHAVNAWGISRHTGDVDLMVPLEDKPQWLTLFRILRYEEGQSDDRFSRFRTESLDNWPIDLMYVNRSTFDSIYQETELQEFGDVEVPVASLKHLVFLKIHALKHFQEHRFAKDYSDLVSLLNLGKGALSREELKQACLKYADMKLYEKLISDIKT